MRDITRTPIIPLDFQQQARAVTREVIIDYDKGEIYAVDPIDNKKLINLTNRIKQEVFNYLEKLQGNQITDITNTYVTIEDVGRVNIADFLKFLSEYGGVDAFPVNNGEPLALRGLRYDNASIVTYSDRVAVAGFDEAGNNYVPVKKNGTIQWTPISNLPTPDGYTPNKYDINDITIKKGVINLTENPIQMTTDINCLAELRFPADLDTRYCIIKWITSVEKINHAGIIFPNNIIWRYSNEPNYTKGVIYIYEFETFDGGKTWYGKRHTYNNVFEDDVVTQEELHLNYFTKQEIIDLISWDAMDEDAVRYENEHNIQDDECQCKPTYKCKLDIRYMRNDYENIVDSVETFDYAESNTFIEDINEEELQSMFKKETYIEPDKN